jgi:hypothetical protein
MCTLHLKNRSDKMFVLLVLHFGEADVCIATHVKQDY